MYEISWFDDIKGTTHKLRINSFEVMQQAQETLQKQSWKYSRIKVREISRKRFNEILLVIE